MRGCGAKSGVASNGATYAVKEDGQGKWQATVTVPGGKAHTLAQGVAIGAAYSSCVCVLTTPQTFSKTALVPNDGCIVRNGRGLRHERRPQ